ncbi:hypothetical protein QL285_076567 [Trifolium repens]|nr:hypothetical protein QL285_076567 [Trifolium repens]
MFTGYIIGGQDSVTVSHLQFADDTLLLVAKSWANVRSLRAVLVLFETLSCLKVNFNKSMLVGVNIPESWLSEAASVMCCRVGKVPFVRPRIPLYSWARNVRVLLGVVGFPMVSFVKHRVFSRFLLRTSLFRTRMLYLNRLSSWDPVS